jgi:hypothetical protein
MLSRSEATSFSVQRGSPAWDAAWAGLSHVLVADGLGDGTDLAQENDGEAWQYMGSRLTTTGMLHTFRHRDHPKTHDREYRAVLTELLDYGPDPVAYFQTGGIC